MKLNRLSPRYAGFIVSIAASVLGCWLAHGAEPSQAPLNVVLLNSGDLFAPGAFIQNNALREALTSGTRRPVNFCVETYSQNLSAIGFDAEFASFMRRKYEGQKIDLIITTGTAALNFLERHRPELWPEAPAMFYSVDEASNLHRKFSLGLTGLTLKFDPVGTLDFAVQLQPDARQVVVVTGASEFDRSWLPDIQHHLQNRYPTLNATYLTNQTVGELTETLGKLSPDTIVLFTTMITDASGRHYVSRDASAQLGVASGAPLYGLYDFMLDHGIVGGVIPSLEAHGRRAGELALRIVAGVRPDTIPVSPAEAAVPVVDWKQIQRWGISENRLPPGTIVRFRPPTLWGQYHDYIIIGLCILVLQAVTIAALLLQLVRRRRAEATIREDRERMALAAEAAHLGIWIRGLERNEIWATDNWRVLLGFTKSERIDLEGFLQKLHPEDREAVSRTLARAIESEGHYEMEYRVVLPDGGIRWIGSRGKVEFNGGDKPVLTRGVSLDITTRKQTEASNRSAQELMAAVFNSVPGLLYLYTEDGRLVRWNKQHEEMTGYTSEELLNFPIQNWFAKEDQTKLAAEFSKVFSEGTTLVEMNLKLKNGEKVPHSFTGTKVIIDGKPFLVGIGINIFERKQAEAEALRQRAELAHVARVSTMGELAASVAHELNQPLGAILANAEAADLFLSQNPPALGELRDILTDIRKDDERASEVIRRMRALLRKHELDRQPLEINSVVEDVLQVISGDAALRKVAISAELAPGLPEILGDRVHLQQVLINLMLNGMDAMTGEPQQRRRLVIRTRSITSGLVELAVTDSGHGIAPEKLPLVFDPFYTTKPNGMGMGLSISRTIIEAHHGKISAENNASGGVTFRVTLPVARE